MLYCPQYNIRTQYERMFVRGFSLFQHNLLFQTKDIEYQNSVDIVSKNDLFFYTVLNVDRYKHFLPHVTDSKIIEKKQNNLKAILEIKNILFKEKYVSLINYKYPSSVSVISEDTQIFHHLITEWDFKEKQNCLNINFYINFRLKNKIYHNFMNVYIKELGKKILYAFIDEAKENSSKRIDVLNFIK